MEVGVRLLRHQEAAAAVGLHDPVDDLPVGVADGVEGVQIGAVEQDREVLLGGRRRRHASNRDANKAENGDRCAFHV